MPYIGRGPSKSGSFRIIDDISSSFNGSTTAFTLQVSSSNLTVGQEQTLLIALDGVMQEPKSAYTISGSTITFASAPATGVSFWGVELGDVGGIADAVTSNAITGRTDLGEAPATGDTLLVYDTSASSLKEMTVANLFTAPAIAGGTFSGSFTGTMDITGTVLSGASPLVFEGASADCHETTLAFTDPTADRTITFPNDTGTVSLTGATETLAAKTLTTPTIASTGWTNATHAHGANNTGGTLDASVLGAGTLPAARIGDDSIVEAKLDVSNAPSNGQFLQAQSGEGGGLTWAAAGGTTINNNADNRLITGSGSADTLEGEQYLTYTGGSLEVSIASGDPKVLFDIGGTNEWFVGVDDSADDALKIGTGGTVGANCAIIFGTDGNVYLGCAANTSFSFGGKRASNIHAGTAAAPSLAFASDSNTGMWRAGADVLNFSTGGTERLRIAGQEIFHNDTANGSSCAGLTLNQLGEDNEILSFKSSDVAHGMTGLTETDTYASFSKIGVTGGLKIIGWGENCDKQALILRGHSQVVSSDKNAGGCGIVIITGAVKCSTSTEETVDMNIFSVSRPDNFNALFMVDLEGDYFYYGSSGTFDEYCDVGLVRAFSTSMATANNEPCKIIRSKWDDHVKENEQTLVELGVLGDYVNCVPPCKVGLVNGSQLQRLHNGAIWQLYTKIADQGEEIKELQGQLKALNGGK